MCSSRHHQVGMTLVELIVAIVIISIAVVAVLNAFAIAAAVSADPMVRKQMVAIAEEMMEEITLKPFSGTSGASTTCIRNSFQIITDYNGYNTANTNCQSAGAPVAIPTIYDIDGNALPTLNGYAVFVTVSDATLPPSPQSNGVAPPNCKQITVTVTNGSNSFTLPGWRTNYGG